jgi:uncharacterized protein YoxC
MNEGLLNFVLVLAAVFFVTNTILFIVLGVALFKISNSVKELQPQVTALSAKVDGVMDKMHDVGDRMNALTASIQSTADTVGNKARSLVSSAGNVAHLASAPIEKYSPVIAGFFAVLKVVQTIRGLRRK